MKTRCVLSLLVLVIAGCGDPSVYRIRTNVPWPDQWAAGPRHPDYTQISVAEPTLIWHRQANLESMQDEVRRIALKHPGSLVMTRVCWADRHIRPGRVEQAFRFLEVRITAWPLPLSRDTGRYDWSFDQLPLAEAAGRCAARLGTHFAIPEGVDVDKAVTFRASKLDAPTALASLLLRNDLYVSPTCLGTSVVRSYEFLERSQFLRQVQRRLNEADAAQPKGPYDIVSLAEWARRHCSLLPAVLDTHTGLPAAPTPDADELTRQARQYLLRMLELRIATNEPNESTESGAAPASSSIPTPRNEPRA